MTRLTRRPSPAAQAKALATTVATELGEALAARGAAALAVPGGTTPAAFLRALSAAPVDWARVSVLPTDERLVDEGSPRSNAGLIRRTLLTGPAAAARLVPLTDAAAVAALLPLDVCVLGMGADGHVASLFPGGDRLAEALAPDCPAPVLPMRAPAAPEPRLTLTAPVLTGARRLHLLIRGRAKLAALERARRPGPPEEAPVRILLARPDLAIHYADDA